MEKPRSTAVSERCLEAPTCDILRRASHSYRSGLGRSIKTWRRYFWVFSLELQSRGSSVLFVQHWILFIMLTLNHTLQTPLGNLRKPGSPSIRTLTISSRRPYARVGIILISQNFTPCNTTLLQSSPADPQTATAPRARNVFTLISPKTPIELPTRSITSSR